MNEPIKIEDGIPFPRPLVRPYHYTGGGGKPKSRVRLACESLEVGQSFLIPAQDEQVRNGITTLFARLRKDCPGREFTTRRVVDGGRRVWRIV